MEFEGIIGIDKDIQLLEELLKETSQSTIEILEEGCILPVNLPENNEIKKQSPKKTKKPKEKNEKLKEKSTSGAKSNLLDVKPKPKQQKMISNQRQQTSGKRTKEDLDDDVLDCYFLLIADD